jgi:hypothetical protein
LFFYERATQSIQKVAALGDPTPIGGTFGSVGLGTINDHGEAVFLAWKGSNLDGMILRWNAGSVQMVAAVGDPAPHGAVFAGLTFMTFGTPSVPAMPPNIREDGHVCFLAAANWQSNLGLYEEFNGQFTLLAATNDSAPGGGVFSGFGVPVPNEQGEFAFSAQQRQPPAHPVTWFRGRPGQWERVLGIGDVVAGKLLTGITSSGGPHASPFDDAGNLLLPVVLRDQLTSVETSAIVIAREGFSPEILLQVGDLSPLGQITQLAAYAPMTPNSVGAIGMEVSTPAGLVDAHMLIDICIPPDATVYCTAKMNSAGVRRASQPAESPALPRTQGSSCKRRRCSTRSRASCSTAWPARLRRHSPAARFV